MSNPNYGAAVTPTDPYPLPSAAPVHQDTPSAKERAHDVAQTGKQAVGDVAQTASGAAQDVAQESRRQVSDLVDKTRTQLREQAGAQKDTLVDSLRSVHEQLEGMTRNNTTEGAAVDLVDRARQHAKGAADWLERREPNEIVDELRTLGRRQPGQFLVGALLAGVAAGRLTRGSVAVHTDSDPSTDSPAATSIRTAAPPPRHSAPRPTPNSGLPLIGEAPGAVPSGDHQSDGYPSNGTVPRGTVRP